MQIIKQFFSRRKEICSTTTFEENFYLALKCILFLFHYLKVKGEHFNNIYK